jgi:hypothetical protein
MTSRQRYTTEDGVTVYEGEAVYDYYGMEPVIIGESCGTGEHFDGWFHAQLFNKPTMRSRSGMLNGARICTMEFAAKRDFPGAKEALAKIK